MEIEPYLHRIAEIAPLEFTERQQFLLTNPGLLGALRVTNTIRIAVSIYKPGDQAPQHLHTPSASRTILSETRRLYAHRGRAVHRQPRGFNFYAGRDLAWPRQ